MLASDVPPTRLEQAKRKLRDLLEARHDAQTAIVLYAGSAHSLVPLSDDLMTTGNLLEALKPSIMPEPGQRADLAVEKALALLKQGAQGQGRLLLITSSLSEEERNGIRQALGSKSERLSILGIGTSQGAPIAQENGGFIKDAQGAILLPRLDAPSLKRFASSLGADTPPPASTSATCATWTCSAVPGPCAKAVKPHGWKPGPTRATGCCCRCC